MAKPINVKPGCFGLVAGLLVGGLVGFCIVVGVAPLVPDNSSGSLPALLLGIAVGAIATLLFLIFYSLLAVGDALLQQLQLNKVQDVDSIVEKPGEQGEMP